MCYVENDIFKYQIDELESYCKHKYNLKDIQPKTDRFRNKCAEIWAYNKAIDLCKERYLCDPDDVLYELAVYFSLAQLRSNNLKEKNCFEHAYWVIVDMQAFLEKI